MTPITSEIRFLARWGGWLVGLYAVFGLFFDLAGLSLRQWDEARLAVAALEMTQGENWLVTTFGFEPDLWNTKPPLMVWLQAGLIRLIGPTEWAIRLPAALAALTSIGLVYWFLARWLHRPLAGVLGASVLVAALGFMGEHHGHTGDYDALLTLAHCVAGLSLLLLLETDRQYWWLGVGAGLIMGTRTKGVAALLPWPGIALYCLAHERGRRLLRRPGFWLVALGWLATAAGWYVLREQQAPGYWQAIHLNELGGRFATTLEGHDETWYYYLARMIEAKFLPWTYLLVFVVPFALRHPDARARRVAWFAFSWALGLLLVLTCAKTKIDWYLAPAYPWLAMLIGLGAPRLAARLLGRAATPKAYLALRVLVAALVVLPPLFTIRYEIRRKWRDANDFDMRPGYGLRALRREAAPPAPLSVVATPGFNTSLRPPTAVGGTPGYNAALRFYVLAYPRPIRVIAPAEIMALRGPGYVLTANPLDSARVRAAFPQAPRRAVGRYPCWLWTLPAPGR